MTPRTATDSVDDFSPLPAAPASLQGFETLVDAEDYFQFFDLPFDPHVLAVSRLHILRHFSAQLPGIDAGTSEGAERHRRYREALGQAHALFAGSSGVEQKLFAVFRRRPGHIVTLGDLTP
jgi:nitrogenase-stabilizing/protective protein